MNVGVCPSCGKPFRIEERGEERAYCSDVCISPAAMPTGERLMPDQAKKLYVDGNMQEMTREDYIEMHGVDPQPIMEALNRWREDQIRKWLSPLKSEDEVNEWIKRLTSNIPGS